MFYKIVYVHTYKRNSKSLTQNEENIRKYEIR